jgi:FkbM family methyltransferase
MDVGANIGQFAIAAGSLLRGSGVVIAIEPHPAICAELLRNRALNGLESTVIIVPTAIADRRKLAAFGIPSESNRGSSREVPEACADRVHVFTSSLRAVCEELQLKAIDVMKIDVEGAELTVLRSLFDGGADLRPRHIVCEYVCDAFDYRDERGDLMACLADEGYVIRSVDGMAYSPSEPLVECNIWASLDRGRDGARCN